MEMQKYTTIESEMKRPAEEQEYGRSGLIMKAEL